MRSNTTATKPDSLIESVATTAARAQAPLVSIIVSTFRHAGSLADTVEAVLAQDLEDELQLVICDDASPDSTPEIMQASLAKTNRTSYAGPRTLTYVRLSRNQGPATGRNVAIDMAMGRFLAFTDSDCIPAPNWLRAALASATAKVGIVQGRTHAEMKPTPLFEHHIDISHLDGTFATAN